MDWDSLINWFYGDYCHDDELYHYGTPRHSGRYPWGSGDNPYQHCGNFLKSVNDMRKQKMSESDIAKSLGMTANQYAKSLAICNGPEFLNIKKYYKETGKYKNDTEIAKALGLSSSQYRSYVTIAKEKQMANNRRQAVKLMEKGYSQNKAASIMGVNESTFRTFLKDDYLKEDPTKEIAEMLKKNVDKYGYIDVGKGTEIEIGITQEKKKSAINYLVTKYGYYSGTVQVPQATNPLQKTNIDVIGPPGATYKDAKENIANIQPLRDHSTDNGKTFFGIEYPASVDSKRIQVIYDEDGGSEKDGVIEIRRGVKDLSLGGSSYAQVRIAVDDKLYCKGMAIYRDDMPPGVDLIVNSNKKRGTPLEDVLKPLKKVEARDENGKPILDKDGNPVMEINKDNPFGAVIKANGQTYYPDKKGDFIKVDADNYRRADKDTPASEPRYSLSCINKLKEEGDWEKYSKSLSSQFLSKQNQELIDKQLALTIADKEAAYKEICSIQIPEVKKNLLLSFGDTCDADAYKLKSAALPGQTSKVILPVQSLKDTEVYAPTYKDGTQLALVRYPHGGLFEIPIVTVNNSNKEGKSIVGPSSQDAIGINSKVAEQLSGADFDGDTVVAIPTNTRTGIRIASQKPLDGLKNFNTKQYKFTPEQLAAGVEVMSSASKGKQMGIVSNLITDMTFQGADENELARAVRHSMVVIDAEKHKLDYKQSYIDNNIRELQIRYQGKTNPETGKMTFGAGTLISRAKSDLNVPKRKEGAYIEGSKSKQMIDPKTGEKLYTNTGESYTKYWVNVKSTNPATGRVKNEKLEVYNRYDGTFQSKDKRTFKESDIVDSKVVERTTKINKMLGTSDANTLVSEAKTAQELAYAKYANHMKELGNRARLEYLKTENSQVNPSAAKTYSREVASLKAKLNDAYKNAPRERQAQIMAYDAVEKMKKIDSTLTDSSNKEALKRAKQQAIAQARATTGAKSKESRIVISPNEWEAIKAGAVGTTVLTEIIKNTDMDVLRDLATPKDKRGVSEATVSRIKAYRASGYTIAQIAEALGVSTSTVSEYSKG